MKKRPLAVAFGVSALIVIAFALGLWALGQKPSSDSFFSEKVGVVVVRDVIVSPGETLQALEEFQRDGGVRAIVLRVNSPGGGVGASQEIYREIERVKKHKPVVCSMGGVAASGGYYIAAPCTKIVASRGTITGSIGVITAIPNLEGLLDKIGIKVQTLKAGSLKGAGQMNRALTEPERAMLQAALDDIHHQFIEDVAKARKMPQAKVAEIANGGIFTGRRAKQLGLVDELGNFQDAVHLAARLAGIKGRPQLVTPQRESKSWLSRLFRDQASAWLRDLMAEITRQPYQGPMYLYQPEPAP